MYNTTLFSVTYCLSKFLSFGGSKVPPGFLYQGNVDKHFWYICFLGLLVSVTDGSRPYVKSLMSMYVQEPLAIGRRGCTGRDLNGKMTGCRQQTLAVACEGDVSEGVQ